MFKGFQNFFFGFIGLVFREELKVVISQVLLYSDLHALYIYIYIYIYIDFGVTLIFFFIKLIPREISIFLFLLTIKILIAGHTSSLQLSNLGF